MADDEHCEMHDCTEVLTEVHAFLDGEITAEVRLKIAAHLEECPPCFDRYDFNHDLRRVVAQCCSEPPPEGLVERVRAALIAEGGQPDVPGA